MEVSLRYQMAWSRSSNWCRLRLIAKVGICYCLVLALASVSESLEQQTSSSQNHGKEVESNYLTNVSKSQTSGVAGYKHVWPVSPISHNIC